MNRFDEAGLFLILVAAPLTFTPFSSAPFMDPKFVLLVCGVFLLTLSRPQVDRRIGLAAGAWVAVLVVSSALGVDFWWSLMGAEYQGTGLVALASAALLLCLGTGLTGDVRSRIPSWIFWTGVGVGAVAILSRFVSIGGATWRLDAFSATLGHRVFVGGFVAAAIVSGAVVRLAPATYVGLLVLGSGLAVSAVRSAWIGAALGLVVTYWRSDRNWKAILRFLAPVVIALLAWTLANVGLRTERKGVEFSAAPRFTQLAEGSVTQRLAAWPVLGRSVTDQPVLGSGLGTSWYDFLTHLRAREARVTGRHFEDSHNIFIEIAVTSGLGGLLLLVVLGIVVVSRARKAPKDSAWAAGLAVALLVVHLFQPLNLVLTPLMFLAGGLSIAPDRIGRPDRIPRLVVVGMALCLVLACNRLVASSLERYGKTYASQPSLRWAMRLEPWRILAAEELARDRAVDYRSGDRTAADEVRRLMADVVRKHAWNPDVRIVAANLESVLDDPAGARRWIDAQLRVFPNDSLALGGAAALAYKAGNVREARVFALRALARNPNLDFARRILSKTTQLHDAVSNGER